MCAGGLRWRDTLVMTDGYSPLSARHRFCRGLAGQGVPFAHLGEPDRPLWAADLAALATGSRDQVWTARMGDVQGLERKLVVMVAAPDGVTSGPGGVRAEPAGWVEAASRATTLLILVK